MAAKNIIMLSVLFVLVAQADEPTAKTLKKCPLGHTTLKDVPIVYGLLPWEGPEAEKWRKAEENLEFVSGGCVLANDSPKYEVICTACRFAHSISSTKNPECGHWSRSSPDMKSFPKPFSDFVKLFPIPPKSQLKEPLAYTQSLDERLDVRYESISYHTARPAEDIKASVEKWLKARNIKYSFSSNTHTSDLNGAVRDIVGWKTDDLSMTIDMHHEHSDKSSWIHATSFKRTVPSSGSNNAP